MRPSKLKPGTELKIKFAFGKGSYEAEFIKRIPAALGRKATNHIRVPDFKGLNGPDDDGTCEMSDYELSRRGEIV